MGKVGRPNRIDRQLVWARNAKIRAMYKSGEYKQVELARIYKLPKGNISRIISGKP